MYYFTTALVVEKNALNGYIYKDIAQSTMQSIYDDYSTVFIKISRTGLPARWVNMYTVWSGVVAVNWTQTLEMWLMAYPPALQIAGVITNPSINANTAIFSDGFRAGYDIQRISDTGHPLSDVPMDQRKDLLLTRFATDYDQLSSNVLVTVNGLCHRSTVDGSYGLRVFQGGVSNAISGKNLLGLYSFRTMGGIETVSITDTDILSGAGDFTQGFYINLMTPLTGKTLLLSIGGYLHYPGSVFKVINPEMGLIKVFPKQIHIYPRIWESLDRIDLTTLGLTGHPQDARAINPDEVWTEAFWRAYFTLSQSFAVVVGCDDVYVKRHALENAQLDGVCISYNEPIYPIQLGTNLIKEYWVRYETDQYVVTMDSMDRDYFQYTTTNYGTSAYIIPNRISHHPSDYAQVNMVEFGNQSLSWT